MRSTEEFWNRRNLAESTDLENWLLSRQVLPNTTANTNNAGNRTPSAHSGIISSGNTNRQRNRRSRSEERPKNGAKLHTSADHRNAGNGGGHVMHNNNNNNFGAQNAAHHQQQQKMRAVNSEKELKMMAKHSNMMNAMVGVTQTSEDSGNSSLNTSTTDSRKSRRHQIKSSMM